MYSATDITDLSTPWNGNPNNDNLFLVLGARTFQHVSYSRQLEKCVSNWMISALFDMLTSGNTYYLVSSNHLSL